MNLALEPSLAATSTANVRIDAGRTAVPPIRALLPFRGVENQDEMDVCEPEELGAPTGIL